MYEALIVRHCAPTLAGMKTGSLFSCPYTNKNTLCGHIRALNQQLGPKGLRVIPLRFSERRVLIYLYRPYQLKDDLSKQQAEQLLKSHGYCTENPDRCVAQLSRRMCGGPDFPHEIGLFLGYPPEDVQGFIENRAGCCKCVGCWKVYGDEQSAKKQFEKYKKCTDVYCSQWANGKSIERLTVPTGR